MPVKPAHMERLRELVTLEEPLGPSQTEPLVNVDKDIFRKLYDESNGSHKLARMENPFFIVGRKGAGKTAFLIGAAFADRADVILIRSEEVYTEVNKLCSRYSARNGLVVADSLVNVWEVLLFHVAMLQIARSKRLPNSADRVAVWSYMTAFGDPLKIKIDSLLASASATMTANLLDDTAKHSFREACWSIDPGRGQFSEAADHARAIFEREGQKSVYVVVDNLEELHKKLDDFADVITALFRVASRSVIASKKERLPFRTRFAFPAELLPRLSTLAANPEKDFRKRQIIRWTAGELIAVVGNRLRIFLDLYFPDVPAKLALPHEHDPADLDGAARTLRALMPDCVTNGLGGEEDPVAYLMRHTQLLPRHLIITLNEIMRRAVAGLEPTEVPRATNQQVVEGVREAELEIVKGVISTYSYEYPKLDDALTIIKSHIAMVEPVSNLHKVFNNASVARAGLEFDEFVDACLAVGALGIVSSEEEQDSRYIKGEFSYTFADDVRPVEDRDHVCVHPLFVSRLFDRRAVAAMARKGHRAVYPYGSDPAHVGHDV